MNDKNIEDFKNHIIFSDYKDRATQLAWFFCHNFRYKNFAKKTIRTRNKKPKFHQDSFCSFL